MKKGPLEIENRLAALRESRGFSVAELAKSIGVNRQTIYAIEAGNYVPNTAVGLKLARILETTVEDLFRLGADFEPQPRIETAVPFPGFDSPQAGQPVQLGRVDKRMLAFAPSAAPWFFPPSDAVVTDQPTHDGRVKVQIFHPEDDLSNRIVIAGCDPGISVLARHMQATGIELVLAHRNSSQSLELLKSGSIHVAGTHLRDEASGESNLPDIGRRFADGSIAVISFAIWEEGVLTAKGNPKSIRGVEDFTRKQISIVNRERGSGSRNLLDAQLQRLGIRANQVRGYNTVAPGHLPAAWDVHSGVADACIATRAAARLLGLGFVPLISERYDLAIRRRHLDLPSIQTLLDTLSRSRFRRELESLGGYDIRTSGQRIL